MTFRFPSWAEGACAADLSTWKDENFNILRSAFPDFCQCLCPTCKMSVAFQSDEKPCWHGSSRIIGYLYKLTFLRWVTSKDERHRSRSITKFNQLLAKKTSDSIDDKIDPPSDIMQLKSIDETELYNLICPDTLPAKAKKLIQLSNQIILWAWKVSFICFQYFNISQMAAQEGKISDYQKRNTSERKMYEVFLDMAGYLLMAALDQSPNDILEELNIKFNMPMAHLYNDEKCLFIWAECYFHNFRTFFKIIWCEPPDKVDDVIEKTTISEVNISKGRMSISGLSRNPVYSNGPCFICSKDPAKKIVSPVFYALSRDPMRFPREIPAPQMSDLSGPDFVTICSFNCVLGVERVKHPGLDSFLHQFSFMSIKDIASTPRSKWTKQQSKMFEKQLTECKAYLKNIEHDYLKDFFLSELPVKLEPKNKDPEEFVLLHDIDYPRSNVYQLALRLKRENNVVDNLAAFSSAKSGMGLSKAAEKKFFEVNEKFSSLFTVMRKFAFIQKYQKNLKCSDSCSHTPIATCTFTYRLRWSNINSSLQNFSKADFFVKLLPHSCSAMNEFQPSGEQAIHTLKEAFKPTSAFCLIPVNNAYVNMPDVFTGTKFIIRQKNEIEKIQPYIRKAHYLFFIGNIDLISKTCTGGLLYKNGASIIGILLKDAYNFLMDNGSLANFVQQYTLYENNKHTLEEVLLQINLSERTETDGVVRFRGTGEWKFGLLRLEFFRECRKLARKNKLQILPLPQKVFKLTIRLNVNRFQHSCHHETEKTSVKVIWSTQCLGSVPLGQVLRWYRARWGQDHDRFKFFYEKPFFGGVEPGVLVGDCESVQHSEDGSLSEIFILAEASRDASFNEFSLTAQQVILEEAYSLFKVSLLRLDTESKLKLLVPGTQRFADILDAIGVKLRRDLVLLLDLRKRGDEIHQIPLAVMGIHVQDIFHIGVEDIMNLIVIENTELQKIWRPKICEFTYLTIERNSPIAFRDGLGDEHFVSCTEPHKMAWHTKLVSQMSSNIAALPSCYNLLVSSCPSIGPTDSDISSCGVKYLIAVAISNSSLLSQFLSKGLVTDSNNFLATISPEVDPIRLQDETWELFEFIQKSPSSMLLLGGMYSDGKIFYAFLKPNKQKSAMLLMWPKRNAEINNLLKEERETLLKLRIIKDSIPEQMIPPCPKSCLVADNLEVISPHVFRMISNISDKDGSCEPEGMMISCLPKSGKMNDLLKSLRAHQFLDMYNIYSQKRIFTPLAEQLVLYFDKIDNLQLANKSEGVITSLNLRNICVIPEEEFQRHICLYWQFDPEKNQVVAYLPAKSKQKKMMQLLHNSIMRIVESSASAAAAAQSQSLEPKMGAKPKEKSSQTEKKQKDKESSSEPPQSIYPMPMALSINKDSLMKMLDEAMVESRQDCERQEVVFDASPCLACQNMKKKMLICLLCQKAHFCNKSCFKKSAASHKADCARAQQRKNFEFLKSLKH